MSADPFEFLSTAKGLADLERVAFSEDGETPTLLFGHSIELYFEHGETLEKRNAVLDLVLDYASLFPNKISHYHPYDSQRLKKTEGNDWPAYFREVARKMKPDDDEGFDATIYGFEGGKDADVPTPYYCLGRGAPGDERYSTFHAYLPAGWPEQGDQYRSYIELVQRWCSKLRVSHGTAGLSIIFNEGQDLSRDGRFAFPFARRFPGLDYPNGSRWSTRGGRRKDTPRRIRSINWLTAIDYGFVAELGGLNKVKAELDSNSVVHEYDGGILIQAGPKPQLGDNNRGLELPSYEHVAQLLKPLRFVDFNPKLPFLSVDRPLDAHEESLRWFARFDG